jgi:kumamolisin
LSLKGLTGHALSFEDGKPLQRGEGNRELILPAPPGGLQVVYASGSQPAADTGWALESSLDIEWAHAMSPAAKIYLVEAASNSYSDLLTAVDKASTLVAAAGGGVVSMSWGGSEFSGQTSYDTHFQKANVTYLASTGDAPGVSP